MKFIYYFLLSTFSLIVLVSILAFGNTKKELPEKHLEVVLRNIGHQLLLHSKDSTSRILPVTKINEHTYQISFENSFGFMPDTLMNLVHQQLSKTNMSKDYIVNVNDCNKNTTIFAYEINTFDGNIQPCGGREQEVGCYLIQIEFLAKKPFNYAWLLMTFVPIAFVGFYLNRKQNKQVLGDQEVKENEIEKAPEFDNDETEVTVLGYVTLGKFRFFAQNGILNLHDEAIELSDKEIKALSMFASNANLLVERNRFKKEIWEDEGIFVIDRNVDVLVSKLRKKLSGDPSIKIINVHGKGYKFITQ